MSMIVRAYNFRLLSFAPTDSFRLVFAESDFIPGLIVDRFVDTHASTCPAPLDCIPLVLGELSNQERVFLVVQFLALAAEIFKDEILAALAAVTKPHGIFERSDADVRLKEGLEQKASWITKPDSPAGRDAPSHSHITIKENGVLLCVDIERGQKTGYFLDQKRNRDAVMKLASGRRVLDLFSHTGAFGLNAVKGGAREVLAADISEDAVSMIQENIIRNNAQGVMSAVTADAFELLREYEREEKTFDMIILDPPAFAKNAKSVDKAYGGYKEINLRAMKLLCDDGILVTCSCSHFFDTERFYAMLHHAAIDAHKRIQIMQKRGAAEDHPVLAGYPKSEYLKCAIIRVLNV
jgi:23S rRNA (cytosine1962-C5)-methyltransferase